MDFALLASGSKGNAFVVKSDTTLVLVDCGSTKKHLLASFSTLNIEREDLDAILITHDHSDHISQIHHFKDIPIFAPVEISDVEVMLVEPYEMMHIGDMDILPLALSHDAPHTVGYIFWQGNEKLCYITDTGYVSKKNQEYLKDADYYILEANHDVSMLMDSRRPQYVKARIYGDQGHLCNEDCASLLSEACSTNTKLVILAHLSQEANTRELSLNVIKEALEKKKELKGLKIASAGQYEMIRKGLSDEKMDLGTCYSVIGME